MDNSTIIAYVKEITVARLSNTTSSVNKAGGQAVAEYMEEIYNKLVELAQKEI